MSPAYLILCAHTAGTKKRWLSVCYCREIPSVAPLFSHCLCCFTKAIKVGQIRLKGNVQHDWGYADLYTHHFLPVLFCLYLHFIPHYRFLLMSPFLNVLLENSSMPILGCNSIIRLIVCLCKSINVKPSYWFDGGTCNWQEVGSYMSAVIYLLEVLCRCEK